MRYWVWPEGADALVIRAETDPRTDFDVVPQIWNRAESRWMDDYEIAGEMLREPNVSEVSAEVALALIGAHDAA
ncbi:hypothetical protein KIH27_09315 [Mycobacterium sp. M1]|uniref:Uncharacterized protein n=1 Tax=Mycolicibacter acidiphilus TaxID=2835306 RepID=A0ABS5RHK2_9MYCO|nr:hypothetical protein [Mycolicibacter acidiphilus]MBS9533782.1 hypothetical protein [Mycolicibacter acidiphilus]